MDTINSIADQVRNAFPFNVTTEPLYTGDGMKTPYVGLIRSDTGEAASSHSVSRHYVPHTTDDVIALVEAAAEAFDGGDGIKVSATFREGHRVVVAPGKSRRRAIFGTNDNVFPRAIIDAGYDGRAFRASLGTYRDACRNLMMLRRVSGITETIRHSGNLRDEMTSLIDTFSVIAARWDDMTAAIREMEERRVRLNEFLVGMYGEPNENSRRAVTMHRNRTEAIMRRVIRERMQTGRPDLGRDYIVSGWEAFNAVQGYVQHDSRRHGNPTDIERAVMALNNADIAKAEHLAYEMAI